MNKPSRHRKASSAKEKDKVRVAARKRAGGYEVKWHKKAAEEHAMIAESTERVAIEHAIEKLKIDGPALRAPHQSGVKGSAGHGLRELRPRRGRSRWRPIYRRVGEFIVILAIAPEAQIDPAGYDRQVDQAQKRRRALERALEKQPKK